MIEIGIYQALRDDPTVGNLVGTKIFPVLMPKDTVLPAVVYFTASRGSVNSLDGANPLEFGRIQFDCYARDYLASRQLSKSVRDLLVPLNDAAAGFPYDLPDGSQVQSAIVHLDIDSPFEWGEAGTIYRALLDIEFGFISAT
jgi:uncharacterized protein DUF3168